MANAKSKWGRILGTILLACGLVWGVLMMACPAAQQQRVFCCQGKVWFEDYRMPRECAAAAASYRPENVERKDACYAPIAYDLAKCFPRDHHVGGPLFAVLAAGLMAIAAFLLARRLTGRDGTPALPLCFVASVLLSAPMLFVFGTGNQLPLAIAGICLFFAWKDESGWRRPAALVALAVAIALKLVPVFFSLVLLAERRGRDFIVVGCLSAVLVFVPFAWYGGLPAFGDFLECLHIRDGYYGIRDSWGFVGLDRCLRLGRGLPVESTRQTYWLSRSLNVVFALACLVTCVVRCWRRRAVRRMDSSALLLLTVTMIVLPGGSVIYNSLFLVPVFLMRLTEEDGRGWKLMALEGVAWFMLFCPLQVPFSFSSVNIPLAAVAMLILGAVGLAHHPAPEP